MASFIARLELHRMVLSFVSYRLRGNRMVCAVIYGFIGFGILTIFIYLFFSTSVHRDRYIAVKIVGLFVIYLLVLVYWCISVEM